MTVIYNEGITPSKVEQNRHLIQVEVFVGANGFQMTVFLQPGAISDLTNSFKVRTNEELITQLKQSKFSLVIER